MIILIVHFTTAVFYFVMQLDYYEHNREIFLYHYYEKSIAPFVKESSAEEEFFLCLRAHSTQEILTGGVILQLRN
jgi:hypothetical protein